jgi:hypothetical protein
MPKTPITYTAVVKCQSGSELPGVDFASASDIFCSNFAKEDIQMGKTFKHDYIFNRKEYHFYASIPDRRGFLLSGFNGKSSMCRQVFQEIGSMCQADGKRVPAAATNT